MNHTKTIVNLETPEMVQIEKDKKRKRARNEDSYAQNRKIKRNNGEEYTTKKSKLVSAKIFENKDCFEIHTKFHIRYKFPLIKTNKIIN